MSDTRSARRIRHAHDPLMGPRSACILCAKETPQPSPNSEPATETTQAGPGRVEAAPALPSPVVVFTEAQADENLSKLRKWADLMQAAKAAEDRAQWLEGECVRHLLTGFATLAITHGQESREERDRAARLRGEAEAVLS